MIELPIRNEPDRFREIAALIEGTGCFVAGGAARFAASPNEKPARYSDVDLFAPDATAVAKMHTKLLAISELKHETPLSYLFEQTTSFDEDIFAEGKVRKTRFNLIREFCGTPEAVIQKFDFSVARAAIIGDKVLVDDDFEQDEKDRKLRIKHVVCPISTMYRAAKYQAKGYKFPLREMLRLFNEWQDQDEAYRLKILDLGMADKLSAEEIDELEALLRID